MTELFVPYCYIGCFIEKCFSVYLDLSGVPRGTPLYGQPSWWGDDETEEQNGCRQGVKPEEKAQEVVVLGEIIQKVNPPVTFPQVLFTRDKVCTYCILRFLLS